VSWVTWRQHRLEGAWVLIFGAALAAVTGFVAYQLHPSNCPGLVSGYCFKDDVAGQVAQQLLRFDLSQYALVVLPALAGAFIGCSLVAREIENGTHRLAWTQGVTRTRWLLVKLALVFSPVLLVAAAVGILEVVMVDLQGTGSNHWAVFDQHAPMTVASTLFGLSLGVMFGALLGKSVTAMAVTLVVFVIVRVGLAEIARPNYVAPLTYSTHDLTAYNPASNPTAWWLEQPSYYDSAGHLLSTNGPGGGQAAAYVVQHFQPGDRFWAFQTIESAILAGLALVLIGLTFYLVTRRVS